jgi:hypothetical protein
MILHFSHIGLTDGRTFMIPLAGGSDGRALAAAAGRRYLAEDLRSTRQGASSATENCSKGRASRSMRKTPYIKGSLGFK